MDTEAVVAPTTEGHVFAEPAHLPKYTATDNFLHEYRHIISATTASVAGLLVGFPIDTVKVRLQIQGYDSLSQAFQSTFKENGIRSFYRGILPPMFTVSIVKSISFQSYSTSKAWLISHLGLPKDQTQIPFRDLTTVSALAGAVAGGIIALVSCPLELVKIQRQVEELLAKQQKNGTIERGSSLRTFLRIVRTNGVTGLYRGLLPHALRDTVGTATYFASYEMSKHTLLPLLPAPVAHFLSGGMSGVASWLVIFPLDLVKSRIQKDAQLRERQYKGMVDCARKTYKAAGLRGFYTGFSATLLRSFPLHSLNWLVIEATMKFCTRPPPT